MYISFGDKIPSFSLRIVSTMGGHLGIWNGALDTSLHRKLGGGDFLFGGDSTIGILLLWKG